MKILETLHVDHVMPRQVGKHIQAHGDFLPLASAFVEVDEFLIQCRQKVRSAFDQKAGFIDSGFLNIGENAHASGVEAGEFTASGAVRAELFSREIRRSEGKPLRRPVEFDSFFEFGVGGE